MADVNIRERVIALFENGVSASEAGRRYGVDSSTARRWIRRFRDDGESARRPIPGRRRVSTQRQDEELVRAAQIAPFSNIRELRRASHFPGSSRTALRRLKNHGIRSRRALIKEPLSDEQAVDRVAIVSSWEDVDWRKVIFSDECTIESTSKGPVLVYRTDGQRYDARFVATRARSGRISVTCWGWMSYMGAGTLERIQGTFNSACYEHFLENVIIPGARLWYPEGRLTYQHDNHPAHTSIRIQSWFQRRENIIECLPWPPKSPDLNPIEHVWALLKKTLKENWPDPAPRTVNALWDLVHSSWERIAMDEDFFHTLVNSMPRRIQAVIDANGMWTKY